MQYLCIKYNIGTRIPNSTMTLKTVVFFKVKHKNTAYLNWFYRVSGLTQYS